MANFVCFVCLIFSIKQHFVFGIINESVLITELLSNYVKEARPVLDPNDTVQVSIKTDIISVRELNMKQQVISVVAWIRHDWKDPRLTWDKSQTNIRLIILPCIKVWLPSIVLMNSAVDSIRNEDWYKNVDLLVSNDGFMNWVPASTLEANCEVDLRYFPFDEQICVLEFQSWAYDEPMLNLSLIGGYTKENVPIHTENLEWDVKSTLARKNKLYIEYNMRFPVLGLFVQLHRKLSFYMINIIFITALLAMLTVMVFKLPANSGEKISLSVTVLLSFSVFILMINDNMPNSSKSFPLISIYLLSFMTLSAFGICESVFVLYCYHHNGYSRPGKNLKFIVFSLFARISCQRKQIKRMCRIQINNEKMDSLKGKAIALDNGFKDSNSETTKDNDKSGNCYTDDGLFVKVIHEWQLIADITDRFFFILYIILLSVIFVVLIIIIPLTMERKNLDTVIQQWMETDT